MNSKCCVQLYGFTSVPVPMTPVPMTHELAQTGEGREQGAGEHKLTENAERSGGKVEHEVKYFVTLHRERKRWPPNLCSTTRPAPAVMTRGKDPGT